VIEAAAFVAVGVALAVTGFALRECG